MRFAPGRLNRIALFFFTTVFFLYLNSYAQELPRNEVLGTNCPVSYGEADIWYFGQNAGIDFSGETPVALTDMSGFNPPNGCAIISDSTGTLLIYTDGMNVWDGRKFRMPNGTELGGYLGSTQPAVIVPKPGDPETYYIFTVDYLTGAPNETYYGISYSEVDMYPNGGYGVVTSVKNVSVLSSTAYKISAVQHSNGIDYWVVAHQWDSDAYYSYLVNSGGVQPGVRSSTGIEQSGDASTRNAVGEMKISPDGTKIASAIYGMSKIEICDFNASSGQVSGAITSNADFKWVYGIAFSPDNSKLYASTAYIGGNPDSISKIYQFDVGAGSSVFDNPFLLSEDTDAHYYCGMQLAVDGKIYIARAYKYFGFGDLSVIHNPNWDQADCNLDLLDGNSRQFNLGGFFSSWGMPNFIQSYFDLPHFNVDSVCYFDGTGFFLRNEANITSVQWNFGDPESGSNTSSEMRPVHSFTEPGDYTVTVTESYNGKNYTYTENVTINEPPFAELGDTVFMYTGSNVVLDAGDGYQSYYWSTEEETQTIIAKSPGTYWVIVENDRCCFGIDSVVVVLYDIILPNAFRPGGNNPIFRAITSGDVYIEKFEMLIFNRWGQMVFKSESIEEGWDGNMNGSEAPGDVYVWVVNYYVERDGGEQQVTYKGNVVLLR